jgi:dTDP-L-rhamnose 4-epimerase
VRVLVTGAAGFIGAHVVEQLVAEGHDVVAVDNLHPAAHGAPPTGLPDADWRLDDVTDRAAMRAAANGVDAVCHQAARVGLGVDFADAEGYVHDNDVGTAALLAALHDVGFGGRIVLASSMVVYGEGAYRCDAHGPVRPGPRNLDDLDAGRYEPRCPHCGGPLEPGLVAETAPTDPRNVYAATKLHQEHLASAFGREHDVPVTALRYHNVYGPRMPRDTPYAGVASRFRSALAAGKAPQVLEDGQQRRDFVHVTDVARANVAALTVNPPYRGAVNIASGQPVTILEVASALTVAVDHRLIPQVTGGYRRGDVRHVVASPRLAAEVLGFTATIDPGSGLSSFANTPLRAPATRSTDHGDGREPERRPADRSAGAMAATTPQRRWCPSAPQAPARS